MKLPVLRMVLLGAVLSFFAGEALERDGRVAAWITAVRSELSCGCGLGQGLARIPFLGAFGVC